MALLDVSAFLVAVALFGLARWQRERRAARWQHIVTSRLAGEWTMQAAIDPDDELYAPYWNRVIWPKLTRFSVRMAKRLTPANVRRELDQKLKLAGSKQTAEAFFMMRVLIALTALLVSATLAFLLPSLSLAERCLAPLVVMIAVYLFPAIHLNTRAERRLQEIDRDLPEVFDLLSVSVEAGLAFDAALRKVVGRLSGATRDEFSRVLGDMQLGIPRAQSLAQLAQRTRSAPLRRFAGLVAQSDRTGGGIGAALKIQARDIKAYRAARARERAAALPIKILMPMVMFIFPAMFVIILGPAVVSVVRTFHL
ncbi:MAG: type II secretion system protein F [Sulfobacillus acidophilus]|uniref:Type II secretion system protein F n=1 Tax=Sulfobacillus acidophilus TaxID=53633 RepID=A0A2T2WNX6_9FIRM|nr:MAG: type II secretion system protein F [Sulfobacillus acidophilus]